ncbi:MAG: helix-turn-helix domain-containing protein [Bdellovibrionaceae bacterium]|nr:helix-turn-helix domain-containing protein [Pseudobdellovibrionaceae bacterium]
MVILRNPFNPVSQDTHAVSVPKIAEDEILLTSAEAAKLLGFNAKSFTNTVAAGKFPHYYLMGNRNRFKKSELLTLRTRVDSK